MYKCGPASRRFSGCRFCFRCGSPSHVMFSDTTRHAATYTASVGTFRTVFAMGFHFLHCQVFNHLCRTPAVRHCRKPVWSNGARCHAHPGYWPQVRTTPKQAPQQAKVTLTDRQSHWCPLRVLLGCFTLIPFVVQTSALLATKYILDSGTIRLSHPILACCTCMLQSLPPMTLEPQLATNSETRSSTDPLLGRRLAAFCATATDQSDWSIVEAAVQDDPDAAAFVSLAFSFWLNRPPTLE